MPAAFAAFVLTYVQEFLRFLQNYRLLIYPVILIIVMIFRPQGLMGMKEFSFVRTFDKIASILARGKKTEARNG